MCMQEDEEDEIKDWGRERERKDGEGNGDWVKADERIYCNCFWNF